jgi:hypothetical protein
MTMSKSKSASHLRLLFVLAVVIPCLVLGVIAIRSINREKAFMELRLQRTLDVELVHMVSLVNADLDRIREELVASLAGDEPASPRSALPAWKARTPLVGVPFLLSADLQIIWPTLAGAPSEEERAFLSGNGEFVTGRTAIPVYQNIALVYKDEITKSRDVPAKRANRFQLGPRKKSGPPGRPEAGSKKSRPSRKRSAILR